MPGPSDGITGERSSRQKPRVHWAINKPADGTAGDLFAGPQNVPSPFKYPLTYGRNAPRSKLLHGHCADKHRSCHSLLRSLLPVFLLREDDQRDYPTVRLDYNFDVRAAVLSEEDGTFGEETFVVVQF